MSVKTYFNIFHLNQLNIEFKVHKRHTLNTR